MDSPSLPLRLSRDQIRRLPTLDHLLSSMSTISDDIDVELLGKKLDLPKGTISRVTSNFLRWGDDFFLYHDLNTNDENERVLDWLGIDTHRMMRIPQLKEENSQLKEQNANLKYNMAKLMYALILFVRMPDETNNPIDTQAMRAMLLKWQHRLGFDVETLMTIWDEQLDGMKKLNLPLIVP